MGLTTVQRDCAACDVYTTAAYTTFNEEMLSTYLTFPISKIDAKCRHGTDNGH